MREKIKKIKDKASKTERAATTIINIKEESFIVWEAPEFEYQPKDISWYWLSLIISLVLIGLAVWQKNFLFAIFVAVAWLALVNFARKYPSFWHFEINDKGIDIRLIDDKGNQSKFYSYMEIHGFDIKDASDEYKELVIRLNSRFSPLMKINLPAKEEERVVAWFSKYLPKENYDDSFADSLSKLIRF